MAKTVKEYLLEKGMSKELAVQLDEITIVLHHRMVRLKRQGADKSYILMDIGRYRHLEQKNPSNLMELHRLNLDIGVLILNFTDRMRILENYGILKLNTQTAEYEFTAFGLQFFAQSPKP